MAKNNDALQPKVPTRSEMSQLVSLGERRMFAEILMKQAEAEGYLTGMPGSLTWDRIKAQSVGILADLDYLVRFHNIHRPRN